MTENNAMLDQLVERITADPGAGLGGLDRGALDAAARNEGATSAAALAEELELAAAAAMLATLPAVARQPMPDHVRSRTLAALAAQNGGTGNVTELASRRPAAEQPRQARPGWFAGLGWAAAAAMFIALIVQPRPDAVPMPADRPASDLRAELAERPDTITVAWSPSEFDAYSGVSGDVVWNNEEQRGFLRLVGMPANDPAVRQYQLWIVDPERDAEPVDGGVFDVMAAGAEVLIPIDAKLPVLSPSAFAITAEQPGGVVVSEGPLLLVAST